MDALQGEIQALELDLEIGLLSPEESDEFSVLQARMLELAGEIATPSAQIAQADDSSKETEISAMQEQITEKKQMISAAALYVSKRVELTLQQLQMNRVAIQLYEVAKTIGEVKDVFKFTYEGRPYVSLSNLGRIRAGLEVSEPGAGSQ